METTIKKWLNAICTAHQTTLSDSQLAKIIKAFSKSYTRYDNMLLLPGEVLPPSSSSSSSSSSFSSSAAEQKHQPQASRNVVFTTSTIWDDLTLQPTPSEFDSLFAGLAQVLKVTHIAVTRPIPPRTSTTTPADPDVSHQTILPGDKAEVDQQAEKGQETQEEEENILRSPIDFTPVYGDFGPVSLLSPTSTSPTQADFSHAFWAYAKQNGIWQIWAPRWTMFSRGNVSEKARILDLPSVARAVREGDNHHRGQEAEGEGGSEVEGCTAVDLFAGIGYFAFSYVKAGVRKVICWDLNPWSVEGLRRGAERNKWRVCVVSPQGGDGERKRGLEGMEGEVKERLTAENAAQDPDEETRLIVFNENNIAAPERIAALRGVLPPIRHVNCGMLPSSRESLGLAARVLDPVLGGWVHVHENFAESEIEMLVEETRREFEMEVRKVRGEEEGVKVEVEFVNRLKSYAPRVWHCVIDLYVPPKR